MPQTPSFVFLPHHAGDTPATPIAEARRVAGQPEQRIANVYSSADQAFHCGVWEGGVGAWRVRYTEHEFCHMLAGRVRIVGDDGGERIVGAGESFVIPAGFSGIWDVIEPARKLYAIYEASAPGDETEP
jgi:uncharacterized cupin superfamily protein